MQRLEELFLSAVGERPSGAQNFPQQPSEQIVFAGGGGDAAVPAVGTGDCDPHRRGHGQVLLGHRGAVSLGGAGEKAAQAGLRAQGV